MTLETINPILGCAVFFVGTLIFLVITLVILEYFYSRSPKSEIYFGIDLAILDKISPVVIMWHDPNGYYPYKLKIYSDVLNYNGGSTTIENLAETIEDFAKDCALIIERDQ